MDPRFSMLRAALFDLDGTLVRTFIDFGAIKSRVQAISTRFRVGDLTSSISDPLEIIARMAGALPRDVGEEARLEALTAIEEIEAAGYASPEEISGALQILQLLRSRRIKIGIVTRNTRWIALRLLQRMSLPFDVLIAREDTKHFKPHPEPILEACRRLGVDPSEGMMIGDLCTDIASARGAKIAVTVGIQWAHDPPGRFSECAPELEIKALSELLPLLL